MLLAIDVGNTNTVFAVHDGESWVARWRSHTDPTNTADDYAVWLSQMCQMEALPFGRITGCIVSNVVPQAQFNFRNFARRYLNLEPVFVGDPNVEIGVAVRIDRPEQAGADRLVNAVGAHLLYPGALIVVDSGTATTFDIVGEDGGFEGGIIAPGINLSQKALHDAASALPRIAIQRPPRADRWPRPSNGPSAGRCAPRAPPPAAAPPPRAPRPPWPWLPGPRASDRPHPLA